MNMTNWTTIEAPSDWAEERIQRGAGSWVDAKTSPSPYDVPVAIRGGPDEKRETFFVEFKYIGGEEPVKPVNLTLDGQEVEMLAGISSGRVKSVRVSMGNTSDPDVVAARVVKAFHSYRKQMPQLPQFLRRTQLSENAMSTWWADSRSHGYSTTARQASIAGR